MLALFGPAGALPQPCRRRCRFPLPAFSSPSTHTGRPGEHECARERAGAPRPAGRLTDCFVQCAAAADPCLEGDYAVENYGTCCAHGGYKIEGHKEVCRLAKAKLVKSAPHARAPLAAAAACRRCLPAWPAPAVCLNLAVCLTPCLRAFSVCVSRAGRLWDLEKQAIQRRVVVAWSGSDTGQRSDMFIHHPPPLSHASHLSAAAAARWRCRGPVRRRASAIARPDRLARTAPPVGGRTARESRSTAPRLRQSPLRQPTRPLHPHRRYHHCR